MTVPESHPSGDAAWEAEALEAVGTAAAWKLVAYVVRSAVAG